VFSGYFWEDSKSSSKKKMTVTGIFTKSLGCILVSVAISEYL
jgi:hypothetical protein